METQAVVQIYVVSWVIVLAFLGALMLLRNILQRKHHGQSVRDTQMTPEVDTLHSAAAMQSNVPQ